MKRSVILLVMTGVAALGQQPATILTPQPEPWRLQAWKNALRGSHGHLLELRQPPKACAVPLLAVPIYPGIGAKMPISKPPGKTNDVMPMIEGLPPCPRR